MYTAFFRSSISQQISAQDLSVLLTTALQSLDTMCNRRLDLGIVSESSYSRVEEYLIGIDNPTAQDEAELTAIAQEGFIIALSNMDIILEEVIRESAGSSTINVNDMIYIGLKSFGDLNVRFNLIVRSEEIRIVVNFPGGDRAFLENYVLNRDFARELMNSFASMWKPFWASYKLSMYINNSPIRGHRSLFESNESAGWFMFLDEDVMHLNAPNFMVERHPDGSLINLTQDALTLSRKHISLLRQAEALLYDRGLLPSLITIP